MLKPLTIFRSGTHTDASGQTTRFSLPDLEATAKAYNPARFEAPITIGHPAHDAPAWGWVESLAVKNGHLVAVPKQVEPAFADLVERGRFKKLSAAFYHPNSPSNPTPGVYALRHVAFLGAQPPAIKGLPDATRHEASFADDGNYFTFQEMEMTVPQESAVPETAALKDPDALAAQKEALRKRELAFAEKEAALQRRERDLRRAQLQANADELIKAGRLLPRDRDGVVAFMEALPETTLTFGEGPQTTPAQWFQNFLKQQPVQVTFGEMPGGPVLPSLPEGATLNRQGNLVDASRQALHQQIQAYAEQNKIPYIEAAQRLGA
ncbi:MAG: 2-oxoacid:acceptor oxidoreductase [Magnetococcales bacterium]|nr:2-oxoacid:acceptor oxidoreductase [Magnetococcales bacterium]